MPFDLISWAALKCIWYRSHYKQQDQDWKCPPLGLWETILVLQTVAFLHQQKWNERRIMILAVLSGISVLSLLGVSVIVSEDNKDDDIGNVHAKLSDQELGLLARESPKGSENILRTNKLSWIRNSILSSSCFLGEFCNETASWIWREKSDTRKCNFIKCSIFSNIDKKRNQANLLLKTSSLVLLMFILHPLSIDLIMVPVG